MELPGAPSLNTQPPVVRPISKVRVDQVHPEAVWTPGRQYSSSEKYAPTGLREHASALAGLTIVEPSEGSLRQNAKTRPALRDSGSRGVGVFLYTPISPTFVFAAT